MLRW
ncbi:putative efflux pump, partial [Escherichia coli PA10]